MPTPADTLKNKLSLPVIVAPMFLVSTPDMALACCKEGMVGSFPALNQRTSAGLEQWLVQMNDGIEKLKTANPAAKVAPYAVNLIVHKTNPRLMDDLDLCVKHKVPIIITSLGAVPEVVAKIHSYGGIVLHDVTNIEHAKKAAAAGVDGLIAVGAGAGGHAGTINPLVLARDIRQFFDGILVLAGGLSSGQDVFAAEAIGADFAYMGTRFIATAECAAAPEYKQMICDAKASDIIYTSAISGIPANFLRQSLEKAGLDVEALKKGGEPHQLKSIESEAKAWKNVWSAGHGVATINDIPSIPELAKRMRQEYQAAANKATVKKTPPAPPFTL